MDATAKSILLTAAGIALGIIVGVVVLHALHII